MSALMPAVRFSCAIDSDLLFARQAAALVCTLIRNAGVSPRDIVVHHTPGVPRFVRNAFAGSGVHLVQIRPFSERVGYLNKLRQLTTQHLLDADIVVLCDCDLAFVGDIRGDLRPDRIAAAMVDEPNPPTGLWDQILDAAGLRRSRPDVFARFVSETTLFENRNGGLYAMAGTQMAALAEPWRYWARWLIPRSAMLGRYIMHVDQIAFALACLSEKIEVDLIGADCNVPTHLKAATLPAIAPRVLHYHRRADATGLLLPVGVPSIDASIAVANQAIREERQTRFPDLRLWRLKRSRMHPVASAIARRLRTRLSPVPLGVPHADDL